MIAALLAGLRTLTGFSVAAGLCIISDIPSTYTALSQVAVILTLAASTYNARGFGMGALIGTPLAIIVAAILNFRILPHGADMPFLALAIIPVIFGGCLLLMNPKTATIGFNAGVFFFVILGVANEQNYEPRPLLTGTCCICSPQSSFSSRWCCCCRPPPTGGAFAWPSPSGMICGSSLKATGSRRAPR
nr:FUSC family protein [Acetobacter persici]